MSEVVKLSLKFLTEIKTFVKDAKGMVQAPDNYKDTVWKSFDKLVTEGYPTDTMLDLMDKYKIEHTSPQEAYTMEDIIQHYHIEPKKESKIVKKRNPDNLLEEGRFYLHPALQIAPPPPVITIHDDGTFTSSYEEDPTFYLEIRECFTLDDLADQYYRLIQVRRRNKEADRGAFKYLLKTYDLDVILYCIDEASISEFVPSKIFELEDHAENAILILEARKNTLFEVGLDHVIPR